MKRYSRISKLVLRHILKSTTLLALGVICSNAGLGQTLEDYQKMAADSNALLKSKYLIYHASLERVSQVKSLPDPEVSFGYFISPVETRVGAQQAKFSAMQMFPWMGTLKAKKDMATYQAQAYFEEFEAEKDALFYQIAETYYKLYEIKESIDITVKNLEILELYKTLTAQKFETAEGSMVDVLRIQMEIAELENKKKYLEDKEVPLTAKFNQLLNRQEGAVEIADTLTPMVIVLDKNSIADSIMLANDHLQQIRELQRASEQSEIVARKIGAPSLGLGLNYIVVSKRNTSIVDNGKDAFVPMVTFKLPIYRGKYRSAIKESQLKTEALGAKQEEVQNMLNTQMEMAWVDLLDANRRIDLYTEQYQTAAQMQRLLTEAYSTTGKEFEELLRIQRILLKYELEIIKAVKDNNTAVAKLKSLM